MSAAARTRSHEVQRLAALCRYSLLDTPPEESFDRITRTAAQNLGAPFALVSLVARDRIWIKSRYGLDLEQLRRTPRRRYSPLLPDQVLWVSDLAHETCFQSLEHFDAASMIRFYAAAPLRTYDGFTLGTLCVMDQEPREEDEELKNELARLAGSLMKEIEGRRLMRRLERLEDDRQKPKPAQAETSSLHPRDPLTGLHHRKTLLERLARQPELARQPDTGGAALMVLGLDRFQAINGSLGYAAGDRVLIEMARRLQTSARPGDLVVRLGGDEIGILLTNLPRLSEAQHLAADILARLRWPLLLSGQRISVTASMGLVWVDARYLSADEILRDAEIALDRAKIGGRARCEVFDVTQHAANVDQLRLETDLRVAIERNELRLHYQPIVELASGRVRGFEALARWQHPRRGLLRPRDFIGLANAMGLMPALCDWSLEQACRQLSEWHQRYGQRHWTMAVNIDSQQLTETGFADRVKKILHRSGLEPSALELEITETAMMSTSQRATGVLQQLRDHGIALHIDDFGTGYATLTYLHRVPARAVKIDASFVTEMLADERHREIVRGISSLAHNLGLEVIAEGIETPPHLKALRQLGCDHGQGFYFSRPLDPESLEEILEQGAGGTLDPVEPSVH